MFEFVLLALALVGAGVHLLVGQQSGDRRRVVETLLLYILVCNVGVGGLIGFTGHTLKADEIADSIGWPKGSPFQFEVAIANLSYGVLGIVCAWLRGPFWIATVVGFSIFMWGAAYGHIVEIVAHQNYAPNNAGAMLWADILIPIVLLGLLIAHKGAQGVGSG